MRDLIFVVKNDGTYEQVPNKNLRSQENYSDNFVVIANRVGVVKAKIKLLSRTDRVEVKYLVPSLESVSDLIGDKPYFQDYASASVWRGAVPKKLLQEISMSYAGQIEVSFSFLKPVLDSRATNYKGDILTGDTLPETATNGDYYVIKVATYTIGEIVLKYGQTAIWDGAWVKGGTYQVIGTTTTQKMNVEPTLIGEEAEFDIDEADEIHEALEEHALTLSDHEQRILTNSTDISDIVNGELPAEKANKATGDEYGNRISTTYATQNTLNDALNQIENTGEIIAKKAERDSSGRKIEDSYASQFALDAGGGGNHLRIEWLMGNPKQNLGITHDLLSYGGITLPLATTSSAGVMSNQDKNRLDNLHANAELVTNKGQANGYAPLDANSKLPLLYLYDSVLGQLEYVGTFNGASVPTQTQNLSPNRDVRKGDFFISTGSGIINSVDFKVGDWMVFDNPTTWQKVDNTDAVASVNGKLGVVVLNGTDIEVGGGDTTKLNARFIGIDTILNDTYRKNDVYTKIETDNLLNQLKAIYGWEDSDLGTLLVNETISKAVLNDYDMVYLLSRANDNSIYKTASFFPNQVLSTAVISVGDATFTQDATNWTFSGGYDVKVIGVKLNGLDAYRIDFGSSNVGETLEAKADKNETRQIGEELITRTNGKVTSVDSDTVETTIVYDANGEITEITEFYKLDSKTYKTTLTKVEGIITKTTKELI